ncbi:MAG: hypothetical protein K8L99_35545 [Anaerolineae bacterium]|nr:hypothetical protein [Anaerolineae bacterium]
MTIVIGCDSFLALRNVRNGNLAQHLAGERVVAFVNPLQYEGSVEVAPKGIEIQPLIDFFARNDATLAPLMSRAYHARKCYYDPGTMWEKMRTSSYEHNQNNRLRLAASLTAARARFYYYAWQGRRGNAQLWRHDFTQALRQHPVTQQYERILEDLDASVVAAFSLEGPREMALIEAAHNLGLPTLVMIRSRDNLAAKIQHLPNADAFCVWSQTTRDFLLHLYPETAPERVHITGSPQFDRHLDPAYRLTREAFFEQVGLDPDPARRLIVYTCATPELIKHEIHITQHLADAVHAGKLGKGTQLLVRGHPRGFGSAYPLLEQEYADARVYPRPTDVPYRSGQHEAEVVKIILEDEPMHLATLAYQDVQVNVSGTMLVDSAIVDKPSVAVHYDLPADVPEGLKVRRFYQRSDMKAIMNMGGFRVAYSPEACLQWINGYLENPALDAEGRARLRTHEIGTADGKAGERIAALFQQLLHGERNEQPAI